MKPKMFYSANELVESDLSDLISEIYNDVTNVTRKKKPQAPLAPPLPPIHAPELSHTPGKLETGSDTAARHFNSTKFKSVRNFGGGANPIFHGQTDDNQHYVMKPLSGGLKSHEPEHWVARNQASNRIYDAMGKSHLGTETFQANVPTQDQMTGNKKILPADSDDSPEKQNNMHITHAGQPALVSKSAVQGLAPQDVTHAGRATPEQLAKISGHDRLGSLVNHVLMGNRDASHKNVLINTKGNHPINIDSDVSLAHRGWTPESGEAEPDSDSNPVYHNPENKPEIMSVYSPGEDLDYRKGNVSDQNGDREQGEVGTNYPEHIHNSIKLAAAGKLGHGLSQDDHAHLMSNANDLLNHGLEGTLRRRHVVPTYKRQDNILKNPDVVTRVGKRT